MIAFFKARRKTLELNKTGFTFWYNYYYYASQRVYFICRTINGERNNNEWHKLYTGVIVGASLLDKTFSKDKDNFTCYFSIFHLWSIESTQPPPPPPSPFTTTTPITAREKRLNGNNNKTLYYYPDRKTHDKSTKNLTVE